MTAGARIALLTHAPSDLVVLHHACALLPAAFGEVAGVDLQGVDSDARTASLLANELADARVVIVRLLGPSSSVPGFGELVRQMAVRGAHLVVVSGTGEPDPQLACLSTVAPAVAHAALSYFQAGGGVNVAQLLRYLSDHLLLTGYGFDAPVVLPEHGIYHPDLAPGAGLADWLALRPEGVPAVGIIFYRAHWMSGNTRFIDALVHALEARGLAVLPVFTSSLRSADADGLPLAFRYFRNEGAASVDVLINTTSFAMGEISREGPTAAGWSVEQLHALDVPMLQAIASGMAREQWEGSQRGLSPLDAAMNVVMPEFDGRVIGVPVSFKARPPGLPDELVEYEPLPDRIERTAQLAWRFARLRRLPNSAKRVAFIFTNSNAKASQIGNAVGLDAPASLLRILHALRAQGYAIGDLPESGTALIHQLIDRCTYDQDFLTAEQLVRAAARVPAARYAQWFAELPPSLQQRMCGQWGPPPGTAFVHEGQLALAGLELGNAFVALQPPRGYGMDKDAIYHMPDLPPTHHYYALYRWLRDEWGADAMVHVGKHGTLEWLPGKGVGVSENCFPDALLLDLPLFYPFIINDPGEGAQAKRRAHAVVVDHLTPPMTTAGAYGALAQLTQLVDEYYQVEVLDPGKLPLLQQQIWELVKQTNLDTDLQERLLHHHHDHDHDHDHDRDHDHDHDHGDLGRRDELPAVLTRMGGVDVAHLIEELDGYLCELGAAQIRDGLHILGEAPQGKALVDMLVALTRLPNRDVPGLQAALASLFYLDLDFLLAHRGRRLDGVAPALVQLAGRPLVSAGDALDALEVLAQRLFEALAHRGYAEAAVDEAIASTLAGVPAATAAVARTLDFACRELISKLDATGDEIRHLLHGLAGGYVPAGPSGSPTRGLAHVLPTGCNFYSVDPRALPSASAWRVGQQLAHAVLARHLRDTGRYPESVAISVWGTSAMRTHADDVAQILALLGVRPVWRVENRQVTGIEVIPLEELKRPRIDVTVRISGFFRDAFPQLIELIDDAVGAVIARDEPLEQNYLRKHYLAELARCVDEGLMEEAARRACFRVFGSKPGSYGTGILPLIQEKNWDSSEDFAAAYVNWGGYAYGRGVAGTDAREVFRARLAGVEIALHNQDNREHDIFDSDDYLQFHGGMIATVRALTGRRPHHYFGDSHDPARAQVRDLKEETLRVFRARVVNPKWLDSIRRHGYKGGLELTATVDYLFGFDATAEVLDDWMYEELARRYALDAGMQRFFEEANPWALNAIAERLLEAAQRGLWANPASETRAALEALYLHTETLLEARGETPRERLP